MAVGRAFKQAVQWYRAVPSLDVGVHLTLVAERPLLQKESSLVGADGRFPASARALLIQFLKKNIRLADVQAEWSAQIERVLDHGIRVTHMDSHQHVHVLPGLADLCQMLAAHYHIPFVRVPVERLRSDWLSSPHGIYRTLGSLSLRAFWTAARLLGARAANRQPLRFLGFQDGGRLDQVRLRRLIWALRPGQTYELMCHPGFTPEQVDVRSWGYCHEKELHALTHPSIRSEIAARGIELCNFKNVMAS
jgi:predicted glycoside hydrolase/deacetylase ChbG (UPF0249 family)